MALPRSLLLAAAFGLACANSPVPQPDALSERARYHMPRSFTGQSAGHLNEIVALNDTLFVANGQDAFATISLAADGGLTAAATIPAGLAPPQWQLCTTLAVHAPSRTLFCGYAFSNDDAVAAFDISNPVDPRMRTPRALQDPRLTPRRMMVLGDTLLVAAFQSGLLAAPISSEGQLGALRETGVDGDVRFVDGDASRLVALDHQRGLRVLAPDGSGWRQRGADLPLAGPKLGLRVVGGEALVALGSEGAAIVSLDAAGPRETVRLRPPGVVSSVDRAGPLVAVTCLSGVFLYDLSAGPAALRGWYPARAIMLDGRFFGGDLVVTDWEDLVRLTVNPRGFEGAIDVGWGQYVSAGPVSVTLRNPFATPRSATIESASGEALATVALAPGETRAVPLDAARVGFSGDAPSVAEIRVVSATVGRPELREQSARFLRRSAGSPVAPPGVGDVMPSLLIASSPTDALTLPLSGASTRLVFYSHDCAAVWPQLEDLNHLTAIGQPPLGAMPVMIARENPARYEFTRRLGLESLLSGYTGGRPGDTPAAVTEALAPYGEDLYYSTFQLRELRGGAAHPTDYVVAPSGTVTGTERIYRGRYPLP